MNKLYNSLTNLYKVNKTISMSLVPVGETLSHIQKNGLIEVDEARAEDKKKVQDILDRYHKKIIQESLSTAHLEGIDDYVAVYTAKKYDTRRSDLEEISNRLREQVSLALTSHKNYPNLFCKKIFDILPSELSLKDEEKELLESFRGFYSYFRGFHQIRETLYTSENLTNSVGHRLITQNLPRFIDNSILYAELSSVASEMLANKKKDFSDLKGVNLSELFSTDNYDSVLTQTGIDTYNLAIGLCNMVSNEYNQQNKDSARLPLLKPLYKQILSVKTENSFSMLEKFESDKEVIDTICAFISESENRVEQISNLLSNLSSYDANGIYLKNDKSLSALSNTLFGEWNVIEKVLCNSYDAEFLAKDQAPTKSFLSKRKKWFNAQTCFSLQEIENALTAYNAGYAKILSLHLSLSKDVFKEHAIKLASFNNIFVGPNANWLKDKGLRKDKKATAIIKEYLDSIMDILHFIKPLAVGDGESDKDISFYQDFMTLYDELSSAVRLYNLTRNYITSKPYSREKVRLNFESPDFLSGFDLSKEKSGLGVILRKDGKYYLAIMNTDNRNAFEIAPSESEDCYEKMLYKQMGSANKTFPRIVFSKANEDLFNVPDDIRKIYESGSYKKGDAFKIEDMRKLVDYFKQCLTIYPSWKLFDFTFSDTDTYQNINDFYTEVERQNYQLRWKNIDTSYIEDAVKDGRLYLFQIYCKDFSEHSKGKKSLFTLYFEQLFSEENMNNIVYKLDGGAEMFYRKKSIDEANMITHPANEPIKKKNPLNQGERILPYTVIKDKRYTVDKFQLNLSITCNKNSKGENYINKTVNEGIRNNGIEHVIGINRGERNLVYIVISDMEGNIVLQKSLNEIENEHNGVVYKTDYKDLLERKEKERMAARKNWAIAENIKNLKSGYLSQVINILTKLMVEYNAAVVIEDLDTEFKQSRSAIEKSIYREFEGSLINKLNFLAFKDVDADMPGGIRNAYQLTDKFESFAKLNKQSGLLFHMPTWNITNMDPMTGFINRLYCKYSNIANAKAFWSLFDAIRYNEEKEYYEFDVNYTKFSDKAKEKKTKWTICSYGDRIDVIKEGSNLKRVSVNLTAEMKKLFATYNIDYKSKTLQKDIIDCESKDFHVQLLKLLQLTVQLRNYEEDSDYLISPIRDKDGNFFDSRETKAGPCCIDANAAYNLARKGILAIKEIQNTKDGEKPKLVMSTSDWLNAIQGN